MKWSTTYLRGVPFQELETLQSETRDALRGTTGRGVFLVSEPTPTYTAGRAADPAGLIWPEEDARNRGITLSKVSRGGQWTFHGPGQLVVYPLVPLKSLGYPGKGVRKFLETMRSGVSAYLSSLGVTVDAEDPERPFGLYVGGAKLVSFGIAIERGVSGHGLALYLKDQTASFQGIHPCGVPGERLTSLEALGFSPSWEDAARGLVAHLKNSYSGRPENW